MGSVQLRRYEVRPGAMDDFLAAWRAAVVVRKQYGFAVAFAVVDTEHDQFVWAVTHDADFATAEGAYYDSPERAALPVDPASFLGEKYVTMVRPEHLPGA
jgi:antibiotic biosynthesis monooxygenase (ABM) superfamily enzyme